MLGAIMLIVVLPPRNANNRLDFDQVLRRVFAGAWMPVFLGAWVLALLETKLPSMLLHKYPEAVYCSLGVISYFLFLWVGNWLERNRDKGIDEIYRRSREKE